MVLLCFFRLRNKIDLLHPFMKKTDELFLKQLKVFVTVAQEKSFSRAGSVSA